MASYNGEKYIGEQLDSILSQGYRNIEIVIVDDGSTDNTASIIQEYQQRHPFIRFLQNESNLGVSKTFVRAIIECRGQLVALADQDDIWMPQKLQVLFDAIGDYDAAYGNSLLVDAAGGSLDKTFAALMNMKTYKSGASFLFSNTVPGHAMLVKMDFLQSIMPFPAEVFYDHWIGFNAASNNGIRYVDEILVHYRQHESNAVGTRMVKNKRKKDPLPEQFRKKKAQLLALSTAKIKDEVTRELLAKMIRHFHRGWSLRRSLFFFRNMNTLLLSKNKPGYRKMLFCAKMFFKPNI